MRRSTIIYVLLFLAVLGAAYYFNSRPKTADTEAEIETPETVEYVYTAENGLPTLIHIASQAGEVVEVARNEENAWVLTQPVKAPADQGAVEAAATQIATMRVLGRLPNLSPEVVGLDQPEYTVRVQFTGGVERMLEIGVVTPTDSGYYARGEDGEILIISKSAVDALLGLLFSPPVLVTETPPPTSP